MGSKNEEIVQSIFFGQFYVKSPKIRINSCAFLLNNCTFLGSYFSLLCFYVLQLSVQNSFSQCKSCRNVTFLPRKNYMVIWPCCSPLYTSKHVHIKRGDTPYFCIFSSPCTKICRYVVVVVFVLMYISTSYYVYMSMCWIEQLVFYVKSWQQ